MTKPVMWQVFRGPFGSPEQSELVCLLGPCYRADARWNLWTLLGDRDRLRCWMRPVEP